MQQYQWKGQKPQRFQGGRKHLKPENELDSNLQPALSTIGACGIRTFEHKHSQQYMYKPHSKIFPHHYQLSKNQIDLRGKKFISSPQQNQKRRPQRAHVDGGKQTIDEFKNRGIKTFSTAHKQSQKEYMVENKMQQKIRIPTYQDQRNFISTSSLGDKPYKYPQYSVNFYQAAGLIPGSTFRPPSKNILQQQKNKKGSVFTKPNYDVKVKMLEVEQQKKLVNAVDQWQQTILKQANPNWNDPDTFFQRMEAKKDPKDQKKAGKK